MSGETSFDRSHVRPAPPCSVTASSTTVVSQEYSPFGSTASSTVSPGLTLTASSAAGVAGVFPLGQRGQFARVPGVAPHGSGRPPARRGPAAVGDRPGGRRGGAGVRPDGQPPVDAVAALVVAVGHPPADADRAAD